MTAIHHIVLLFHLLYLLLHLYQSHLPPIGALVHSLGIFIHSDCTHGNLHIATTCNRRTSFLPSPVFRHPQLDAQRASLC